MERLEEGREVGSDPVEGDEAEEAAHIVSWFDVRPPSTHLDAVQASFVLLIAYMHTHQHAHLASNQKLTAMLSLGQSITSSRDVATSPSN